MDKTIDRVWMENLLDRLHVITNERVVKLCNIVTRMGLNDGSTQNWSNIVESAATEFYDDIVKDGEYQQNILIDQIEKLLNKAEQLCKQLSIQMPAYGKQHLSLYEEKNIISDIIKEYEAQVEERLKEIRQLQFKEKTLCSSLGRSQKFIPESPLPSAEYLSDFNQYLERMESEKYERDEKFINLKTEIVEIANELKFKPSLDFEKHVLDLDDSSFKVTDSNMLKLTQFHEDLQAQRESVKEEIDELKKTIQNLWKVLDEDVSIQKQFLNAHTGYNLDNLKAFKDELRRCQELKRANIERFVEVLRKDLTVWWDKCHYSQMQRDEFEYYNTDVYSEDLLALHELQIDKLKKYYEDYGELLRLLEQRSKLWSKMLEMEEKAFKTPKTDRYKNRGGQLLQEEKERNALCKKIPEIEKQLETLAATYEDRHGEPFLSWGKPINDIIQESHQVREQDKKAKLTKQKQERDQTLTPAKTFLGLADATSQQNLAKLTPFTSKRKLLTTPQSSAKKTRLLTHGESNPKVKTVPSKFMSSGKRVERSKRSLENMKKLNKLRRMSRSAFKDPETETTTSTEYDAFANVMFRTGSNSSFNTPKAPLRIVVTPSTITRTPTKVGISTPRGKPCSPYSTTLKLSTASKTKLII